MRLTVFANALLPLHPVVDKLQDNIATLQLMVVVGFANVLHLWQRVYRKKHVIVLLMVIQVLVSVDRQLLVKVLTLAHIVMLLIMLANALLLLHPVQA